MQESSPYVRITMFQRACCWPSSKAVIEGSKMAVETRTYVISLLESYHKRMNQIALLHYELEHPANISSDEMIEAMSLSRSDGASRSKGHVSNKTIELLRK